MDVVLYVFNSCMLTIFVLMNYGISSVNTYVSINFQPDIIHMNGDIYITCTVHGIKIINRTLTRQWSKGPNLICYNGHSIDYNKYTEILTTGNQFKLHIKNVSESDFNCKYQCRYGFEAHAENFQLSDDNFEYPPADNTRAVVHTNALDQRLTINLHFEKIFPVPICRAISKDSSLSFNMTSSSNHGSFYKMNLSHTSTNKLQCDEEIVVTCALKIEYTIPTEDNRKCKINENFPSELIRILVGTVGFLALLTIVVSYLVFKRKKRVIIREFMVSCLTSRQRENETRSNSSSPKEMKYAGESLAFVSAEKDVYTKSNLLTGKFVHKLS